MTPLIFDIDGTLVQTSDFEGYYYIQAIKHVFGDVDITDNWGLYKNVTDVGILKQIMEENKIQDKSIIPKIQKKFGEYIRNYLENGGRCDPIKGAVDFFKKYRLKKKYTLGIATGGWGHTAKLKLQYAGFDIQDIILTSCDDHDERVEIMKQCLNKLGGSNNNAIYFGDGDWDQNACQQLGWKFVGVGSNLMGKCDFWIQNFSDQGTIEKFL
jgi:FMN phosphatase YigB (HAD superfamily)